MLTQRCPAHRGDRISIFCVRWFRQNFNFFKFVFIYVLFTPIYEHIKFGKKIENQRNNTQLLYMYFYSRRPATKYFISITGACCTVTTYLIFYLYSRCLVTIPILATTCSISSTGVTRISEMFAKISTLLGLATRMGKLRKVHTVPKKKT